MLLLDQLLQLYQLAAARRRQAVALAIRATNQPTSTQCNTACSLLGSRHTNQIEAGDYIWHLAHGSAAC